MSFRNILIPTDFSENAQNAIDYALAFFKRQKMQITFLYACHVPVITPEMPSEIIYQTFEENKKAAQEKLKTTCQKITETNSRIQCDYRVKQEPVSNACYEIVKEKNIDLVVMGTHGATGLKKLIFGSNAAKVIESSECPVLAIPENVKFLNMKTMLFATNYHNSDSETIALLSEIAAAFDAEIIVVHISEEKEEDHEILYWFEKLVKDKTSYPKISFFLLGKTEIVKGLDQFIKDNNVELLAMSTRSRPLFEKIFSASITKRMAYHTNIPLLAFHSIKSNDNF